ncbi:hypothetical protein [Bradyrhizobium nitroreducens]|nr:hypothetical protein [Bradyrhizobium nitroreducens]
MSAETIVLEILSSDGPADAEIRSRLTSLTPEPISFLDKRNNDGVQSVVAILQASAPLLTALAPIIVELIKQRRLAKVRTPQGEIANPTEQQFRDLSRGGE